MKLYAGGRAVVDKPQGLNLIAEQELRQLLDEMASPVLSIYFPTRRDAVEAEENSLRLKSRLRECEELLAGNDLRTPEICLYTRQLQRVLADDTFWRHQLGGLALFADQQQLRRYRVPFDVPNVTVVHPSPYLRHLFPALFPKGDFYLLALSKHTVRLVHCTRHAAEELDLEELDIPTSLEEALRYDDLQRPDLQHHATTGPGRSRQQPRGGRGAHKHAFHGHGEGAEDEKTQIKRFFQAVDQALSKMLLTWAARPLILAGVDYLKPLYREVTNYPKVLEDGIEGNPDRLSAARLHELALPIIERSFAAELDRAIERYGTLKGQELASSNVAAIVKAAHAGRVESLFVARDSTAWGRYDSSDASVEEHDPRQPDDIDLIDLASTQTFINAGSVYVLGPDQMVNDASLAAIYRY